MSLGVVRRFDLDTIAVNAGADVDGVEWWGRIGPAGWYAAPIRRDIQERPAGHGSWASNALYLPRIVPVAGSIVAPNNVLLQASLDKLAALLNRLDEDWSCVVHETIVKRLRVRRANEEPMLDEASHVVGRFAFELMALDPWKYGPEQSQSMGVPTGTGGGMVWPATFPLSFAAGTAGGTVTIDNNGPGPARVVAYVTGPATNPWLACDSTNEHIEFRTTVLAGDTMVIDFNAHTAKVGTNSRAATRTPSSRWWKLPPNQASVIRFAASQFDINTRARIVAEPAFP